MGFEQGVELPRIVEGNGFATLDAMSRLTVLLPRPRSLPRRRCLLPPLIRCGSASMRAEVGGVERSTRRFRVSGMVATSAAGRSGDRESARRLKAWTATAVAAEQIRRRLSEEVGEEHPQVLCGRNAALPAGA